ncbi:xanthine dehydrogenase family protein molybdopterin-binding subunit [Salipiger sp. IMCC34102]|uniref:xanthine dehydrogenase family protein molybdopterin-binding subunit n=1 Tax=Salipiger sp. IMCC34102 TaxID=2510647 RepID=UPI00101C561E|nr:xanthine dehydrogenase family protein molybdopterin-binding subunit [Salipiger sp. IMCC34102]RYH01287.1 xanthine dehydrogenase family protein molybdopterin-binding subunit [Salipiger sp. IMCC34102]
MKDLTDIPTAKVVMDKPDTRNRLDHMAQGVIHKGLPRPDGPLKVAGVATYAHEDQPEGMLTGVLVRAPVSSGKMTGLNAEEIRAMDGVRGVFHGKTFLRNPAQGTANEAPIQPDGEIFYIGQPMALVVADSFEQARHAAKTVKLQIERSDAVTDLSKAEAEEQEDQYSAQGDLDGAMKDAAFTVDQTYRTPGHTSNAMEPHAAIAQWDGKKLTVRASCQMLKYNVNELADSLDLEPSQVHLLTPFTGGGFGAKLGISHEAVAAGHAAMELGAPVAVVLSRQQVAEATMRRSETVQQIRLAADAEGRLTGIGHTATVSNLPDEPFAEPVTQATPFIYRGENREVGMKVKRINSMAAGSVRAPGEAVGLTALEIAMDELARASGVDPVELRKINVPEVDPSDGRDFSSNTLVEALDDGARAFGWADRETGRTDGDWLIGYGMASATRVNMIGESHARITLEDGKVLVETDMTDVGTGTYAILTQIAAEMLGVDPAHVTVDLGNSDHPKAAGSGGSWGASSSGSSVFVACENLRSRIAEEMGVEETDLTLQDGIARAANTQRELASFGTLAVEGVIDAGKTGEDVRQATFGSFFAEVGVNRVSGEVRVRRMHGSFAAGRILNEMTARSQCLGGMTFGIGMALTEELMFDPRDGHLVNNDMAEYHVPVNLDVPQLTVNFLEERDPWANPMQAKGIGELGICGAGASIVNAIYDACGVRVRDLPATMDKLLSGLPDL